MLTVLIHKLVTSQFETLPGDQYGKRMKTLATMIFHGLYIIRAHHIPYDISVKNKSRGEQLFRTQ